MAFRKCDWCSGGACRNYSRFLCVYMYMYMWMYMWMYLCVYIYNYIYIHCIYICMYVAGIPKWEGLTTFLPLARLYWSISISIISTPFLLFRCFWRATCTQTGIIHDNPTWQVVLKESVTMFNGEMPYMCVHQIPNLTSIPLWVCRRIKNTKNPSDYEYFPL